MISKKDLWSEKIPFLKNLKEFFSGIEYKGINLWPLMASECYKYYVDPAEKGMKRYLMYFKFLFTKDRFRVKGDRNKILCSYLMPREDHHELFLKAISGFSPEEIAVIDEYNYKKSTSPLKFRFRLPDIILLNYLHNKFKKAGLKKTLGDKIGHIFLRTYFRCKQIEQIQKIYNKYKPRGYVAFCSSSFPEEAMFTLMCKKDKVPTFTLQHGFYFPSGKNFSSASVQGENVVSDYHLVWGKRSMDNIKEYLEGKSKAIIVGNPKYSMHRSFKKDFSIKAITFFLSVPPHEKNNIEVVKILNIFAKENPDIKIKLKIHPFDEIKNYINHISQDSISFEDKNMPVSQLLEKSDVVITHYTTIELEALLYNNLIMRFQDKDSLHFWKGDEDKFKSIDEFKEKLKKFSKKEEFEKRNKFYMQELLDNFYFEDKKSVPEIYHREIIKRIKKS